MSEEVRRIVAQMKNAPNQTAHIGTSESLKSMLRDKPAFRKALGRCNSDGENGWSMMLKSVIIGLAQDEKRGEKQEIVGALQTLVDKADECGACFDVPIVKKLISMILDEDMLTKLRWNKEEKAAKEEKKAVEERRVRGLYWSTVTSLCSCPDYFRRPEAKQLVGRLVAVCWKALGAGRAADSMDTGTAGRAWRFARGNGEMGGAGGRG